MRAPHQARREKKNEWLYQFSDDLKKRATEAEIRFATFLDKFRIKYYYQVPVIVDNHSYIIDFVFKDNLTGVWFACEIDGSSHKEPKQKEKDEERDLLLRENGYTPIRIKNGQTKDGRLALKFSKLMVRHKAAGIIVKLNKTK